MLFSNGLASAPIIEEQRALAAALAREQEQFLSESAYDVYGSDGFW